MQADGLPHELLALGAPAAGALLANCALVSLTLIFLECPPSVPPGASVEQRREENAAEKIPPSSSQS